MTANPPTANRHQATLDRAPGATPRTWLKRVRAAMGARDYGAEIAGYAAALAGASDGQTEAVVDHLLGLVHTPVGPEALALVVRVFERLDPELRQRAIVAGHGMWGRACAIA